MFVGIADDDFDFGTDDDDVDVAILLALKLEWHKWFVVDDTIVVGIMLSMLAISKLVIFRVCCDLSFSSGSGAACYAVCLWWLSLGGRQSFMVIALLGVFSLHAFCLATTVFQIGLLFRLVDLGLALTLS